MRPYLKISGLASLLLLLTVCGFAQTPDAPPPPAEAPAAPPPPAADQSVRGTGNRNYDEIIIRRKSDKDSKVTIEIKDGQVLVNGKPASEYDDDNLAIRQRKMALDMAMGPRSPFRSQGGTWSFDGDAMKLEPRAFLGVTSEKSTEGGARIKEVSKGSAAEKAGLKTGDLITRVDEIQVSGPDDLVGAIHKYKPADKVTITYKRDGKEGKATATLGEAKSSFTIYNGDFGDLGAIKMEELMPRMKELQDNMQIQPYGPGVQGFAYGGPSPRLGIKAQDMEEGKGAKVLDVNDDSPADKAGIKEGDVITKFDGKPVGSATELIVAAREARGKASVKVDLLRGGKPMQIEIKTPKKLRTADL